MQRSKYSNPKRRPSNFGRIGNLGVDFCTGTGDSLSPRCKYPTNPDGTLNCNKNDPDCDARKYVVGSYKRAASQKVANMDPFSRCKLLFDRAKVRYGAALGFRRAYTPYVIDNQEIIQIDNANEPIPRQGFALGNAAEPDGRSPTGLGPYAVNDGGAWKSRGKRYHYQSESLIKTTAVLLSEASEILQTFFFNIAVAVQNNSISADLLAEMIFSEMVLSKDVLNTFLDFTFVAYTLINTNLKELFNVPADGSVPSYTWRSFFWEPFMVILPVGRRRAKPLILDQAGSGRITDYYNQWLETTQIGGGRDLSLSADILNILPQ